MGTLVPYPIFSAVRAGIVPIAPGGLAAGNILTDSGWSLQPWIAYTPTVTSNGGTLTAVGALSCFYRVTPHKVEILFDIAITTNGTGTNYIVVTIPAGVATPLNQAVGAGREINSTGKMLQSYMTPATTNFLILNYDNTYPAGSGFRLVGSLSYQT